MKDLPAISSLQGMGEPHYFAFTVDPHTNILTSHGVVFLSVVKGPQESMELLTLEDDPRCPHLVKYIGENFFKVDANAMVADLEKQIADSKKLISKLQSIIDKETKP